VSDDAYARLHRCIRDLVALQALPSMCVGRTPAETLQLVFDALPTVLSADIVYLAVPGTPPVERAWARGREVPVADVATARGPLPSDGKVGEFHCFDAEVPVGAARGRLVAGRGVPLDPATDRVLVRTAANLVGTTLETANVLDTARRKDEFMAMLGHELRNPLAPILTAVELLARRPEVAREQQVIERNTRHLTRLVDDLLDISRVTRGHVELRSEHVSLASVLERAVDIAAPLMKRQGHTLDLGDASGIVLKGDAVRLAQVFGNLLTNAAKFTQAGGRIEVKIERRTSHVRVSVKDNGRGIAAEHLARIFEPFVQIDRKRDALRGGLGLGLAIVHDLVHHHGGTIAVQSDGPGRGTTFTVELPTLSVTPESIVTPETATKVPRKSVRVLVVDDNIDVADLLSEALRFEGFETAVEHDARAALETWRTFSPHAAVFDMGLPEVDGCELAKKVRAQHGRAPVLIAATGYGQPRDRERAADAGFDCHFVKPVSIQDLVLVLDQRVLAASSS
jgi:signal transduction histidine kinase/ActR/RegA family two-component response regulator